MGLGGAAVSIGVLRLQHASTCASLFGRRCVTGHMKKRSARTSWVIVCLAGARQQQTSPGRMPFPCPARPPGARVAVCYESEDNLRALNAAAAARGTSLDVLIEVNAGQDRCGTVRRWLTVHDGTRFPDSAGVPVRCRHDTGTT